MQAYFAGFALGFSLILAIGAQNAFVLRQGLRNAHVFAVVLTCALSDAVLIAAGVAREGLARAMRSADPKRLTRPPFVGTNPYCGFGPGTGRPKSTIRVVLGGTFGCIAGLWFARNCRYGKFIAATFGQK